MRNLLLLARTMALTPFLLSTILFWPPAADSALITTHTSAATWAAAAGTPVSTEDFTDTTLVPGLSISFGGAGAISGGMISGALAVFGLCVPPFGNCPPTTVFNFSPGTTAFGADWDLAPGGPGSGIFFLLSFVGGGTQTVSPGIQNPAGGGTFSGFFGFVSDTAFSSVSLGSGFTGNGETFNADNVVFRVSGGGGGGAVPAPATLTLMLIGAGAAAALMRKR